MELFSTLGATQFNFNTSLGPFNDANRSPRFDFISGDTFSWSIGARGILYSCKRVTLGAMCQYFTASPKPKVLFIRTNVDTYPDETTRRKFSEWQVGAGISYTYNCYCIPYAAFKYSRTQWDFDHQLFNVTGTTATIPTLRNRKHWGYAMGLTLAPLRCKKMAITAEGRFGDETALYLLGEVEF